MNIDDETMAKLFGTPEQKEQTRMREAKESPKVAAAARLPRHDEGNALRVTVYLGDVLRYCKELDQWYLWHTHRWNPCHTGDLLACGRYVADMVDREVTQTRSEDRETHRRWSAQSHSARSVRAMVDLARGDRKLWVRSENLDADPWLLNFTNGTVDLRTGELRPHDPGDLITRIVSTDYDPNATAPTWTALVARTFYNSSRDGETLDFVQRALGYSVVGNNPEQRILIVEGDPSTGKSKLLEIAGEALGPDYAHKSKTELIARVRGGHHDSERLSIAGKRFVWISETSSTFNLDESTLKELTGDSSITTRKLYDASERVTPVTWTIWLTTNEFPNVLEWDDAVRRRVVVIQSGPPVPDVEQDLVLAPRILASERAGVLTYLVRGCVAWYQAWLAAAHNPMSANTGLSLPPSVMMRTQQYAESQDHIGHFISECIVADEGARTPRPAVLAAFKRWRGRGETANRNQLYARIQSTFGCEMYRGREFVGIRLVDPEVPSWPRVGA